MHWGLTVTWWSFFFAKELLLMATCNRCFGFGQILLQQSCNLKNLTNLTKLKYFLSPANHGFAAKGKLFCFCLWYLMAVDLAADANVDYRKDFSETERKLAAGSGIWKVQRRKLLTVVVPPSSAVFQGILRFYFSWIWVASVVEIEKHQKLTNEMYFIEDCNWKVQN